MSERPSRLRISPHLYGTGPEVKLSVFVTPNSFLRFPSPYLHSRRITCDLGLLFIFRCDIERHLPLSAWMSLEPVNVLVGLQRSFPPMPGPAPGSLARLTSMTLASSVQVPNERHGRPQTARPFHWDRTEGCERNLVQIKSCDPALLRGAVGQIMLRVVG